MQPANKVTSSLLGLTSSTGGGGGGRGRGRGVCYFDAQQFVFSGVLVRIKKDNKMKWRGGGWEVGLCTHLEYRV